MMNSAPLPLKGLQIAVTRPCLGDQCPLAVRLESLGARTLSAPMIQLLPPRDWSPTDTVLKQLESYQTLVFLSRSAVHFWTLRAEDLNQTDWLDRHLVAMGSGTANALSAVQAIDLQQPDHPNSESLARWLVARPELQPLLIIRANRGSDVIESALARHQFRFEQIAVYRSEDAERLPGGFEAALDAERIDWITVTSRAMATNLVRLAGKRLERTRVAAISPAVAEVLNQAGLECAAVAERADFDGLIQALVQAN